MLQKSQPITERQWRRGLLRGSRIVRRVARRGSRLTTGGVPIGASIAYSELLAKLPAPWCFIEPHDPRVGDLCGRISQRSYERGRGLLSVLIVHKTGDMMPGKGFFDLAEELGLMRRRRTPDSELSYWIEECNFVYNAHRR